MRLIFLALCFCSLQFPIFLKSDILIVLQFYKLQAVNSNHKSSDPIPNPINYLKYLRINKIKKDHQINNLRSFFNILSCKKKGEDLPLPPKVLLEGIFVDLATGQQCTIGVISQESEYQHPQQFPHFLYLDRTVSEFAQSTLQQEIVLGIDQPSNKFSIYIFLIVLFYPRHESVEVVNPIFLANKECFDLVFRLLCADIGEDLIYDVGFCVLFLVDDIARCRRAKFVFIVLLFSIEIFSNFQRPYNRFTFYTATRGFCLSLCRFSRATQKEILLKNFFLRYFRGRFWDEHQQIVVKWLYRKRQAEGVGDEGEWRKVKDVLHDFFRKFIIITESVKLRFELQAQQLNFQLHF